MVKLFAKCFGCDTSIPDDFKAVPSSGFDRLLEERSATGGTALRVVTHTDILRYDESPRPVLVFANNPAADGRWSTAHSSADQCQRLADRRRAAPIYYNRAAACIFTGQTDCKHQVGVAQTPNAPRTQLLADLSSMEHPFLDMVSEALQRLAVGAEPDRSGDGAAAVTAALEALRLAIPLHVQLKNSTVNHVPGTDVSPAGAASPAPGVHPNHQSDNQLWLQVIEAEAIMYKHSLSNSNNSCVSDLAVLVIFDSTPHGSATVMGAACGDTVGICTDAGVSVGRAADQPLESAQTVDPSSSRPAAATSTITEVMATMADAGTGQPRPQQQQQQRPLNLDMQFTTAAALSASRVPSVRAPMHSLSKPESAVRTPLSAPKVRSTSDIEGHFAGTSANPSGMLGLTSTPLPGGDQPQRVTRDPHHGHHDLVQVTKAGDPRHHHWLRLSMVLPTMEPIVTAFTSCGRAVFYQNEGSIAYYGVRPVPPISGVGHVPTDTVSTTAPDMRAAVAEGSGLAQLFALEPIKLGRMLAEVSAVEGRVWKGIIEAPASCAPPVNDAAESLAGVPKNADNLLQLSLARRDVPGGVLPMLCPTLAAAPDEGGDVLGTSVLLGSMGMMGTAGSIPDLFRTGGSTTTVLDMADPLATSTWGLMVDNGEHTYHRSSMERLYRSPPDRQPLDDGLVGVTDCNGITGGGGGDDDDGLLASTSDAAVSLPSHTSPGSSIPSKSVYRPQQTVGQRVCSYNLGRSSILSPSAPRLPLSCQQQRQQQRQQQQRQQQQQPALGVGVRGGTPAPRVTSFSRGSADSLSTASGAGSLPHTPSGLDTAKSAGTAAPAAAAVGFESVTDTAVNALDGGPYVTTSKFPAVAGGPCSEGMGLVTRRTASTTSIHPLSTASRALAIAAAGAPASELSSRSITSQHHSRPSGSRRRASHVLTFASSLPNAPQVLQQAVAGGSSFGSAGPPGVSKATVTTRSTAFRSGGSGSPGSSAGARAHLLTLGLPGDKATGNAGITTRVSSFTAGSATNAAATALGKATPSTIHRLKSGALLPPWTGPVAGIGSSHAALPGGLLLAPEEFVRPAIPSSTLMHTLPAILASFTDTFPKEKFSFPAKPAAPGAGAMATVDSGCICGDRPAAPGTAAAAGPAAADDGVSSQQRHGDTARVTPAGIVPSQPSCAASGLCLARVHPNDLTGVPNPCFDRNGGSSQSGCGRLAAAGAACNVSGPQTRVSSAKAAIIFGSDMPGATSSDAGRVATPSTINCWGPGAKLRFSSPSIAAAAIRLQDASSASMNAAAVGSKCQTQLPADASSNPQVAMQAVSLAIKTPLLDGPDAVRQQQQPQRQQPAEAVWYEVTARRAVDPLTGGVGIVVIQTDVTAKVLAERHLALVAEAEHRLLEQIFPRHVLAHMAEEGGILRPPPPSGSHPPSGTSAAAKRMSVRDVSRMATTHPELTLLFADIQGFTPMCQTLSAHVVMSFLNDLFTRFDRRLDEFGVYKVETIGDCYFVAGGLIEEDEHGMPAVRARESRRDLLHAERVLMFAKAMLAAASEVRLPTTGEPVKIRIGIHSGPVVSGVVGERMPRFCLFGDTVNTTSRMESTGVPGAIHASEAARRLLPNEAWVPTGGIDVKGKGRMNTYLWLPPDKDEAEKVRSLAGSVSSSESHWRNHRCGSSRRGSSGSSKLGGGTRKGTGRAPRMGARRLAFSSGFPDGTGGGSSGGLAHGGVIGSRAGNSTTVNELDQQVRGSSDGAVATAKTVDDDGANLQSIRCAEGCGTEVGSSYTHGSAEHRSQEHAGESVQGLALMLLGRKSN